MEALPLTRPPWPWCPPLPFNFPFMLMWKVFYYFIGYEVCSASLRRFSLGVVFDWVFWRHLSILWSPMISPFDIGVVNTELLLIKLSIYIPVCDIWTASLFIVFSFLFQFRLVFINADYVLSSYISFYRHQMCTLRFKCSLVVDFTYILTCSLLLGLLWRSSDLLISLWICL